MGVRVATVILAPGVLDGALTNSQNVEVVLPLRTSELARFPNWAWHPMGTQKSQWDPSGDSWNTI